MSMCVDNTPLEHYPELGLWVKREDLCCPGGPNFSKTRGVYAHVASRPERIIGVLDTSHSQGGWAVARACALLGRDCHVFYPEFKWDPGPKSSQMEAFKLGAALVGIPAGRSAVIYHRAKKILGKEYYLDSRGPSPCYMMPNALKLPEMITETVAEVHRTFAAPGGPEMLAALRQRGAPVIVSASSGTIAAGVMRGLYEVGYGDGLVVIHQGYSRPAHAMLGYMREMADWQFVRHVILDEGYSYADKARPGPTPSFPCNEHYDLKAFRWWMAEGRARYGEALLWNIG